MQDYFNYFTEIERYFQTRRQSFTLLSTLDWVLMENWKDQGIPLQLVLKGIDRAFESAREPVQKLIYCAPSVMKVVKEQQGLRLDAPPVPEVAPADVRAYLDSLAAEVEAVADRFPEFAAKFQGIVAALRAIEPGNVRKVEQELVALEERMIALIQVACDEAELVDLRREVDAELTGFRSTMTTEQLAMIEQQLWRRLLLEHFNVPRLSLFYLF